MNSVVTFYSVSEVDKRTTNGQSEYSRLPRKDLIFYY